MTSLIGSVIGCLWFWFGVSERDTQQEQEGNGVRSERMERD